MLRVFSLVFIIFFVVLVKELEFLFLFVFVLLLCHSFANERTTLVGSLVLHPQGSPHTKDKRIDV